MGLDLDSLREKVEDRRSDLDPSATQEFGDCFASLAMTQRGILTSYNNERKAIKEFVIFVNFVVKKWEIIFWTYAIGEC